MGLVAFFQQEMPVFQLTISTALCLTETQSRHSHETWDVTRRKHETRAKTRHELIHVSRYSQDRDMKNMSRSRQSRDRTRVSRLSLANRIVYVKSLTPMTEWLFSPLPMPNLLTISAPVRLLVDFGIGSLMFDDVWRRTVQFVLLLWGHGSYIVGRESSE